MTEMISRLSVFGLRTGAGPSPEVRRTALIAVLSATLLVGLALLQWNGHVATRQGFFDRFQTRGEYAASFITAYVDDVFEREADFARRHLSGSPTPIDVRRMNDAFGFVSAVVVEDGRYVTGSPHDRSLIGRDLTTYEHVASAADGVPTVSNVVASAVRGVPVVGFATPVRAPGRDLVVSGALPVEHSPLGREYLENISPIEGATVFLVDEERRIVASSRDSAATTLSEEAPALARATSTASSVSYESGGRTMYATSHRIGQTPWTLVMSAPSEQILSPLRETWPQWVLLAALTAAAALTVALLHRLYESRSALQHLNDDLETRVSDRTSELAASNAELESFAYSVSHDLRAPLRAMDGFSRIVLDEYAPALPPEAQRFLGMVRENATKMQTLIDDLLRYSRLSRHDVVLSPVDVNAVVASVVKDLTLTIEDHGTEIEVADLPAAQGDASLLWQVFSNLIGNAVKFSRGETEPKVAVGAVRSRAGKVTYWVRDNGIGFDMAYANKLFGVFQRLHRAEDYEGSGVGLATVHRIVNRHGGRTWADSAPGRGATFYIEVMEADDGERREDTAG